MNNNNSGASTTPALNQYQNQVKIVMGDEDEIQGISTMLSCTTNREATATRRKKLLVVRNCLKNKLLSSNKI